MTSDGQSVERLREYLRNLKPEARAMLIAELERAQLRGDDMAGSELVLEELRRTIRIEAQRVPRIGDAARGGRRPGRQAESWAVLPLAVDSLALMAACGSQIAAMVWAMLPPLRPLVLPSVDRRK